jgi:hypothetical protein
LGAKVRIEGLITIQGKERFAPGVAFDIEDEYGRDLVSRGFAVEVPAQEVAENAAPIEVPLGDPGHPGDAVGTSKDGKTSKKK